ncbi:MAG: hypothetical protein ABL921_32770 [Pirellula sp.]
MNPEQLEQLVREQGPYVFDRMFSAMEKVRERLNRACTALAQANVPYAVIGGNAVAAWVATIDDGAVRNTRDVDILLREADLDRAAKALIQVGFHQDSVMNVVVFLDGPDGKPSQGIHVLLAGKKVRPEYVSATPDTEQVVEIEEKKIVSLKELVEMKLNSFRRKDQTHLLDLISIGLIDASWPSNFPESLAARLQSLLDDPEG